MQAEELDNIGHVLGRWLAPYVAAHLDDRFGGDLRDSADAGSRGDRFVMQADDIEVVAPWDDQTCRIFVRELGDTVVRRAQLFFGALDERGQLTSVEVKELLGLQNQRAIGANLTVSLRKRVKSLGLMSEPWEIGMTDDGERTIWRDRDGNAARMHAALQAEASRRNLDSNGGQ